MTTDELKARLDHEVHVTWKQVCIYGGSIVVLMLGYAGHAAVLASRVATTEQIVAARNGQAEELVRIATELKGQVSAAADFRVEVRSDISEIQSSQRRLEEKLDALIRLELEQRHQQQSAPR